MSGARTGGLDALGQIADLRDLQIEVTDAARHDLRLKSVGVANAVIRALPWPCAKKGGAFQAHGFVEEHLEGASEPVEPWSVSSVRAAEIVLASKSWRGMGGSR